MKKEHFDEELAHIRQVAGLNSYTNSCIDDIIKKHKHKATINSQTKLSPIESANRRVKVAYTKYIGPIKNAFKTIGSDVIFATRDKLKN